jgi:4-diphosphocytidyl-2-C-methyl-D-erythritol kinase
MTEHQETREFESWPAPAKINLFLHVTGRRGDGYHEIQTLFQLLDWGDTINIRACDDGRIRRTGSNYGVEEEADLVVRAALLLKDHCHSNRGAEIQVKKRIPMGSGMGGGSSDAATVLLALNRLWRCHLTMGELCSIAVRLGADVPVFVRGHSAMATGIGECLQPVKLGGRHYVLVFPGVSIATAEVFSDPLLVRNSPLLTLEDALSGKGRNDCQAVVLRRYPVIGEMMQALRRWGQPMMTGTGSALFIPMSCEKQAKLAAREIKSLYNSRAVTGLDRSPVYKKIDPVRA